MSAEDHARAFLAWQTTESDPEMMVAELTARIELATREFGLLRLKTVNFNKEWVARDIHAQLAADARQANERLQALLEQAQQYTRHKDGCSVSLVCGVAELRVEIRNLAAPKSG